MTVESQTTRKRYAGTSTPATDYPVTFTFQDDEDLEVIHTDSLGSDTTLTLDTHYSVTGGSGSTGTVSVTDEDYRAGTGEYLTIRLNLEIEQQTDLVDNAALSASIIEAQFDRNVRVMQQLQEEIGRSVKVPASSDTDPDGLVSELVVAAAAAASSAEAAAGSASGAETAQTAAEEAQAAAEGAQTAAEAARDAIPAAEDILVDDDIGVTVEAHDPDILKADTSDTLEVGYPATPKAMVTAAPTPATGALQSVSTASGAVALGVPVAAGVIRFIVTGANALTPSASYDSIDGEYDTATGLAQGEIVSDGTHHMLTIVNGVTA